MGFFQKLFAGLFSKGALEAESRDWMIQCPCGHENSVWELGGIRFGAKSTGKKTLMRCRKCNERTWHRYYRKSDERPPGG
jgi:hypothetical protein